MSADDTIEEKWKQRGWIPTKNPRLFFRGWRVWQKEQGQVMGAFGYLFFPDDETMELIPKEDEGVINKYTVSRERR